MKQEEKLERLSQLVEVDKHEIDKSTNILLKASLEIVRKLRLKR